MATKNNNVEGIQLRDTKQKVEAMEFDRPRTSTAIARQFQYLKQKMGNESEINKQRRTSRIERGLNPDAPKPPAASKGKAFLIQAHQSI